MIDTEKEYDSLRQDIRQMRSQRLVIFGSSATIISAMLGWLASKPDSINPAILAGLLCLLVSGATLLTSLFHLLAARAGTYIMIFHEKQNSDIGWERRHMQFRDDTPFTNLQVAFSILYGLLLMMSSIVPFLISNVKTNSQTSLIFFTSCLLIALATLLNLTMKKNHVEKYKAAWSEILESENLATSSKTINE
ncbi:hypothetical protein [Neptuniibacter sp. QD34_54]|uniref:hypothetical protein n=1 Tax=Neptuniibacter sp. QD34_54 TaxID=3398208 RepID=UPI0039F55295